MSSLWIPCIVLFVLIMLLAALLELLKGRGRSRFEVSYRRCETLLTIAEQRFFESLRTAIDPSLAICPKVRPLDVLRCPKGKWSQTAVNKISSKHLDFVLVDARSTYILLAVELDDSSHRTDRAKTRDAFVDEALKTAGIPIMRVKAAANYEVGQLQGLIRSLTAGSS